MLYLPLESEFASILAAIHMLLPNCLYWRRCSKSKWFPCVPWGWWLPLPLLPPLGFLSTLHRKTIWRVSSPSSRCQTESNPSLTLRFHSYWLISRWPSLRWFSWSSTHSYSQRYDLKLLKTRTQDRGQSREQWTPHYRYPLLYFPHLCLHKIHHGRHLNVYVNLFWKAILLK